MTGALHPANGNRLLVIVSPSGVSDVLAERVERPIVALLTSHSAEGPSRLEQAILSLLDNGCAYFVCFGVTSEALHDRIDELVVERASDPGRVVMTTWHDKETPAEVAEFFFNVAAAKPGSLLVAALEPRDGGLASSLIQEASA